MENENKPKTMHEARAERSALSAERADKRAESAMLVEKSVRTMFAAAPEDKFLGTAWEAELKSVNSAVRSAHKAHAKAKMHQKLVVYESRLDNVETIQKSDLYSRLTDIAAKYAKPAGMSRKVFKAALKDARDNAKPGTPVTEIIAEAQSKVA